MYLDYRRIEGYPDYIISNYGIVYSTIKYGTDWRELKPDCNVGYKYVNICKDGNVKKMRIHVLVGNHFVGLRTDELTFDHIDQNKTNNRSDNIRLATKSEQSINQKLRKTNKLGEKNINTRVDKRTGYEYYLIQIRRNGKHVFRKSLNKKKYKLADAVKLRDDFLLTLKSKFGSISGSP